MSKFANNKLLSKVLLLMFIISSSCALKKPHESRPAAHILMPTYNTDKFIIANTQSVLNQNYPNWKLIIFDDGSTDSTFEKIQQLLEERPDLK